MSAGTTVAVRRRGGRVLRKAREAAGFSLRGLAEALPTRVSPGFICDVEHGERNCPAWRLRAFATALNLTDATTAALFVAWGVLPPDVVARLLAAPETWDVDFKQLGTVKARGLPW